MQNIKTPLDGVAFFVPVILKKQLVRVSLYCMKKFFYITLHREMTSDTFWIKVMG